MRKRADRDMNRPIGPLAALLALGIALAACSPSAPASSSATAAAAPSPIRTDAAPSAAASAEATSPVSAAASSLTIDDAARCPVTKPGKAPSEIGDRMFGGGSAVGNGDLWVGGLGPDGVIPADARFVESDGSIGWKFGWWRIAPGKLAISGSRLDAVAPPLRASVPDGYGQQGFQASGVYFPTGGCWEVTGAVGDSELTFVAFVIRT
jgi:hypothetical protein